MNQRELGLSTQVQAASPPKSLKAKPFSRVRLFATPQTVAYQAPPSMGFSRQEHWSGLLFPSPGDLSDPGIKHGSSALQADSLPSVPQRRSSSGQNYKSKRCANPDAHRSTRYSSQARKAASVSISRGAGKEAAACTHKGVQTSRRLQQYG